MNILISYIQSSLPCSIFQALQRITHTRDPQKLSSLTATDKLDDYGNLKKKYATTHSQPTRTRKPSKKLKSNLLVGGDDSSGDEDFKADSSASESDDDDDTVIITNSEVSSCVSLYLNQS